MWSHLEHSAKPATNLQAMMVWKVHDENIKKSWEVGTKPGLSPLVTEQALYKQIHFSLCIRRGKTGKEAVMNYRSRPALLSVDRGGECFIHTHMQPKQAKYPRAATRHTSECTEEEEDSSKQSISEPEGGLFH